MAEMITNQLELWGLNPYLIVAILAMMPVGELRGSMIFAAALKLKWYLALPISIVCNMLPIPFVILMLRPVLEWLKKTRLFGSIATKFHNKILEKGEQVHKYEQFGLMAFVAIPLPGTGGWTGAAVAALLDMRMRRALPTIFLGIIVAGIIMTVGCYFLTSILSFFAGIF